MNNKTLIKNSTSPQKMGILRTTATSQRSNFGILTTSPKKLEILSLKETTPANSCISRATTPQKMEISSQKATIPQKPTEISPMTL